MLNVPRYSMEVKALFKRIGVQPHVIELDHLGPSPFSFMFFSLSNSRWNALFNAPQLIALFNSDFQSNLKCCHICNRVSLPSSNLFYMDG